MNYSHKIVMVADGANVGTDLTNVAAGDILMLDKDYATVSTSAAAGAIGLADTEINIVAKNSKKNIIAHKIKRSNLVSASYNPYSAAAQKVMALGYNGTSGSLVSDTGVFSTASKAFGINFVVNEDYRQLPQKLLNVMGSYQTALSGSTQVEVVSYIYRQLTKSELLAANSPMQIAKVELLHNAAGTANTITSGADATHYTFTKGSKLVLGTNSSGVAILGSDEVIATTVAGDYVRPGTATTDSVYEIVGVTNGTGATPAGTPMYLELATPFQGETTSIAIGSTEYITAAQAAAGNFGFKFTGLALNLTNKFDNYSVVDFDVFANLGFAASTTKTVLTAKSLGTGVGADVYRQELKYYSAELPTVNLRDFPQDELALNASQSTNYDILVLRYNKEAGDNFMQSSEKVFPQTLVIAIATGGAAQSGTVADLTDNGFVAKVANWIAKNSAGDTDTWTDVG